MPANSSVTLDIAGGVTFLRVAARHPAGRLSTGCRLCYCLAMGTLKYDLQGQVFGMLTALHHVGSGNWLVRCACGTEKVVTGDNLRKRLRSCGCSYTGGRTRFNTPGVAGGENSPHRRPDDQVSYSTAHKRVSSRRGAAALHACVICQEPAQSWAYRGGSPKELIEERPNNPIKQRVRYSPDPDDYDPMCWACHARKDYAEAPSRL